MKSINSQKKIMKKYQEKSMFEKNDNFTIKDELQLTCLTLNTSLKSNYFSLKESDTDKLSRLITETLLWLLTHQTEPYDIYKEKLNMISDICNTIYHSMHKMKALEDIHIADDGADSDEDGDDTDDEIKPEIPSGNKTCEKIDDLLQRLPDKLIGQALPKQTKQPQSDDVLLKIDLNKLNSGSTLRYKNIEHHWR